MGRPSPGQLARLGVPVGGRVRKLRAVGDSSGSSWATYTSKLGRIIFGHSLWPCQGQGASQGEESVLADSGRAGEITARVGRVRSLDFLNSL